MFFNNSIKSIPHDIFFNTALTGERKRLCLSLLRKEFGLDYDDDYLILAGGEYWISLEGKSLKDIEQRLQGINVKLTLNFANNPSNPVEGYEHCHNVKEYLRQQSDGCGKNKKKLALATGYAVSNVEKFQKHRQLWHELKKPIPRRYLEAVGVDLDVLAAKLEYDIIDYNIALALPRSAERCILKYMPGVYGAFSFGEALPEEEAIERTKAHVAEIRCQCTINFPGLIGITVELDGTVATWYYKPRMEVNKAWVTFGWDGASLGTMRVG